jgi:hypothetical protein
MLARCSSWFGPKDRHFAVEEGRQVLSSPRLTIEESDGFTLVDCVEVMAGLRVTFMRVNNGPRFRSRFAQHCLDLLGCKIVTEFPSEDTFELWQFREADIPSGFEAFARQHIIGQDGTLRAIVSVPAGINCPEAETVSIGVADTLRDYVCAPNFAMSAVSSSLPTAFATTPSTSFAA